MARNLINGDATLRATKPKESAFRITGGEGLYLLVQPNGAKWWRFDYSIHGKRKTLSLGVYPAIGLAAARRRADEAHKQVAEGIDPSARRKEEKETRRTEDSAHQLRADGTPLPGSFKAIAREWYANKQSSWVPLRRKMLLSLLERDILPGLGHRPIAQIHAPEVLEVARKSSLAAASSPQIGLFRQ